MSNQSNSAADDLGQSFFSHLIELRTRIVRILIVVLGVFVVLTIYPGTGVVYDFLAQPMINTLPENHTMIATGVITPFLVPLKVTLLVAFLISLPVVLYQIWAFIAPGLYKHEKRLVVPLIVSSTLLFFIGMLFCYYVVFHTVFQFIAMVAPASITVAPDIAAYLSFVMTMFLAFGLTFQVPVIVIVLASFRVITVEKLKSIRGYVIVAAFVLAAVLTPPDVVSQLLMAIPLCLLYELGIFLCRFVKIRKPATEEEA